MQQEGIRGLYRSYPITVMMNIPFASAVITCNENLKTMVKPWEKQNSYFWYFFCAGISGGIAGFITNPLDVVKTRLQTQEIQPSCPKLRQLWEQEMLRVKGINPGMSGTNLETSCCDMPEKSNCGFEVKHNQYSDFKSTMRYIYRNEGLLAFTKGVLPRMSINVPATALSWGTYEAIKSMLGRYSATSSQS